MQNMKTTSIITLLGCAGLLLTSCDVKDPIYNTPHPDHGIVTGVTEWSQRGEGVGRLAACVCEVRHDDHGKRGGVHLARTF